MWPFKKKLKGLSKTVFDELSGLLKKHDFTQDKITHNDNDWDYRTANLSKNIDLVYKLFCPAYGNPKRYYKIIFVKFMFYDSEGNFVHNGTLSNYFDYDYVEQLIEVANNRLKKLGASVLKNSVMFINKNSLES